MMHYISYRKSTPTLLIILLDPVYSNQYYKKKITNYIPIGKFEFQYTVSQSTQLVINAIFICSFAIFVDR